MFSSSPSYLVKLNQFEILENNFHSQEDCDIKIVQEKGNPKKKYYLHSYKNDINPIRIIQEVQLLRRMQGPSIVKLKGYSHTRYKNGKQCVSVIFENNPKENLYKVLFNDKILLSGTQKQILMTGIAHGLKTFHNNGILFSGINLKSILVNNFMEPSLTFKHNENDELNGFCRTIFKANDTPIYKEGKSFNDIVTSQIDKINLPIEIFDDDIDLDSDTYTFGMLMYEIIFGETIYKNFSFNNSIHGLKSGRIKLSTPNDFQNEKIGNLILDCLCINKGDRPSLDEIYELLGKNEEYRLSDINSEEFERYVEHLEIYDERNEWKNKYENEKKKSRQSALSRSIMSTRIEFKSVSLKTDLTKYSCLKKIDSGSFGNVYLCENIETREKVAAKVSQEISNISLINQREINILCQIQHPSFIRIKGYSFKDFQDNNSLTILMEYMKNGSLAKMLNMDVNQNLSNTDRQTIAVGIAYGMKFLHFHNIIHRDLKPSNVLLDDNNHPKISDFGTAKFIDPKNPELQSQSGIGTPIYQAPEVFHGELYGKPADVYSFGILLYELFTSRKPYSELNLNRPGGAFYLLTKVVDSKYRPKFNFDFNPKLKTLIMDCWDHNPNRRPSFDQLYKSLRDPEYFLPNVNVNILRNYVQKIATAPRNEDIKNEEAFLMLLSENDSLKCENQELKAKIDVKS
ncbi:hypothetical protein TRFO_10177 [Tritrichomonas foetus]|uniref:Protein kinase domain-containing protein n=1 Tax=Tritrichomonas foetus TaxID=1144522 RepID=A0A1J4JCM2_9EUKA|nr:hypothetical protein TRFO_10177 [Tritrichomonas foetus]|eukprot:OHS96007.1 hypothetical protein TRFO_10177 [Tritrichomonas foetus]